MARQTSSSAAPGATPKKTRWYQNLWQAYQVTRKLDPAVTWWLLGTFVVIMGAAVAVGFVLDQPVYFAFLGLPISLIAMLPLLARRLEAANYKAIEGQPGASLAALRMIRRGWDFPEEPVALDARTQDLVFRGIGRAGVVLISEGPAQRVAKLLEKERKRVNRVVPNVPVILVQCGDGEGQVPLRKLSRHVQRLRPVLTKQVVAEVTKRLTSLGGASLPVPKGVDPMRARPDRKGMRGR